VPKKSQKSQFKAEVLPFEPARDTNQLRPKFCLQHLISEYDIQSNTDKEQKAAFAEQLQKLSSLTWSQIQQTQKHGFGQETIRVSSLLIQLPEFFADSDKVLAFRYQGKLPMIGVRSGETLHLLAIARNFSQLYKH
jgi:UTP-glucose-1-phosphate uridylyltransferase